MKTTYYRQCKLQMTLPDKVVVTTSWIPEDKAQMGKLIDLEPRGGKRTGPWEVVLVGSVKVEFHEALDRSQDYKHQREASDI